MGRVGIPEWKRWLSYLFEMPIERRSSAYNEYLYVCLKNGRLQLCSAKAVYSYEDLYTNFTRSFERIDFTQLPSQDVLILGFGLGSIPYMLEKVFHQTFHYLAVEIDEEVIDLANTYTLPQLQSPVQLVYGEAFSWVHTCEEAFSIICMDVFRDDEIPSAFQERPFLEQLKRLLQPGGLILYNRLAVTPKDRKLSRTYFEEVFKPVFPNAALWDVGGNYMLINTEALNHPD